MYRIVSGAVVAIALALVLADASIAGIAAWKIVLAAIGLVLFILGGRSHRPPDERTARRRD